MAAYRLAEELPGRLLAGKVTIVTGVNSTALARRTRCGDDGLDLARTCPGDPDGSSTQRDAAAVSELIRASGYLIDLHTGGRIFDIYPMAGYMIHPDPAMLQVHRDMAIAFGLPLIWGTEPSPNGRTLSVARDAGVPSIYVEYGGGATVRSEIADAYVKGCLGVLASLKMTAAEAPSAAHLKYWIEDDTPNNGHLQSKMPAPADGIFVPAVEPGTMVAKGDLWGDILDPVTGRSTTVVADDTGIVLFIRADAVVKAGDSLGGITAINERTRRRTV
jgi:predicted deacylase